MSSSASILDVIQHYQRSIEISQDNEPRLLHCINKLYKLPIKVEHLQKTGVGKTVNSLRKFNGEIGVAAKSLVTKWKAMVAAEEESIETTAAPSKTDADAETPEGNDGPNASSDERHDENYNRHENKYTDEQHKNVNHKNNNSINKNRSPCTSTSSMTYQQNNANNLEMRKSDDTEEYSQSNEIIKNREEEANKSKSRHRESSHKHRHSSSNTSRKVSEKKHRENDDKYKNRHHSRSDQTSSSKEESAAKSIKEKEKVAKHQESNGSEKRHHKTDNEFKSPPSKKPKTSRTESKNRHNREEREDDGFDSSMGANFGDILGMLNVPRKKSKKSSKSSPASTTPDAAKDAVPKILAGHCNPTNHASKESPVVGNVSVRTSKTSHLSYSPAPLPSCSKTLTTKPDLLAPTAKLEPLDPSIALELPTISTNYKPLPLNPTVMDCVFNTNTSNSTRPARTLSDAEAINHGISSKTIRTKVYSGVRTGQIYQVSSLYDLCIRFLQKNIDALEYTGGVPYDILQPVLKKATPHQLFTFEDYNPYLMEDTDDLWQMHVSRNYRTQKRLENETWREMYLRCQEEEERKLNFLADSIKQSQKIAAAPVRKTQLAFVDTMVKPPRNVQRKQEQYGTKAKMVATPAARVASLSAIAPNAAKLGDVRLKVVAASRDHAQVASTSIARPKKAPLMQKTLQFIRGRLKR